MSKALMLKSVFAATMLLASSSLAMAGGSPASTTKSWVVAGHGTPRVEHRQTFHKAPVQMVMVMPGDQSIRHAPHPKGGPR